MWQWKNNMDVKGPLDDLLYPKGNPENYKDGNGCDFPMHMLDGICMGPYMNSNAHDIVKTSLEVRDDDIWLVSFPRSGQHWLWDIVYRMTHGLKDPDTLTMEERCIPDLVQLDLADIPSPRVVRTHFLPQFLPQDIFKKQCKMIHIVRHPKDAAYSWYKHITSLMLYNYKGEFDGFLSNYLKGEVPWGSWFDHTRLWVEKGHQTPILFLTFEECKQNIIGTLKKVASYIGKPLTESDCKELLTATDIKKMQAKNEDWKLYVYDDQENNVIVRKGNVGGWKEQFTNSDSDKFNDVYKEKVFGIGLPYDNCLDTVYTIN